MGPCSPSAFHSYPNDKITPTVRCWFHCGQMLSWAGYFIQADQPVLHRRRRLDPKSGLRLREKKVAKVVSAQQYIFKALLRSRQNVLWAESFGVFRNLQIKNKVPKWLDEAALRKAKMRLWGSRHPSSRFQSRFQNPEALGMGNVSAKWKGNGNTNPEWECLGQKLLRKWNPDGTERHVLQMALRRFQNISAAQLSAEDFSKKKWHGLHFGHLRSPSQADARKATHGYTSTSDVSFTCQTSLCREVSLSLRVSFFDVCRFFNSCAAQGVRSIGVPQSSSV